MSHLVLGRFALVAALTAIALPATLQRAGAANPSPSPTASSDLQQIGHVVTSDRRSEPLGSSSRPTFVVDRAQIDAYGARTVADALVGVPGVELFPYGPFGAEADYGIRGSTSEQTLVLVDGIPVTDPTTGAVQLGQFSTIGVDRIEIVESGSSTLYGTSAAGGVINIITRVPRGTYLEVSDGSFADRDVRAGAGNGTVGFSLERHVATDAYPYPALAYSPATSFSAGVRDFAYGDQSAGRLSLDLPAPGGFTVRARADASAAQIGVPGSLEFPSTTASQGTSTESALVELERASHASTFTLSAAGSQTRLDYYDPINNFGESDVYSGRSQISLKDVVVGANDEAVAGIDLARESGVFSFPTTPNFVTPSAPPIPAFSTGHAESQSAAYVQFGASPLDFAHLTAGLRAENDAPQGSVLAPSFGGTLRSGSVRFAGDLGESFRVPTLQDLYYPGFSNPHLLPEKAQTADATVSYDAQRATFSAGWFDRNGSNFIVLNPVTFVPENAQRAASAGVTLTASSKPFAGVVAAASFTDLYLAQNLVTGARLPRNPTGSATFSLTHPFARERLAYGARWGIVGSDGDDKANVSPLESEYDAYDSLDAFVRYKFGPGAIVSLRGFNLGNEAYAPVFAYPAPGRRLYVELSTR